jgi:hypothetical protein
VSGLSRMARSADYRLSLAPMGGTGEFSTLGVERRSAVLSRFALVMMPVEMRRLFNDVDLEMPGCFSEPEESLYESMSIRHIEALSLRRVTCFLRRLNCRRPNRAIVTKVTQAHRASSVRCDWVRIDPRVVFGRLSPGLANGETVSRAGSFGPRGR